MPIRVERGLKKGSKTRQNPRQSTRLDSRVQNGKNMVEYTKPITGSKIKQNGPVQGPRQGQRIEGSIQDEI